ncbi:V-type ATP synthase subunit E [Methanopyrus kandleri]|jgi:V/A-type H+-transporting ATPase subunit E
MGVEELERKILEDAEKEAEEILEEAKRDAERIREKAEREAEEMRREILDRARREAETRRRREIAQAKLEVRQERLRVKEEYIEKAIERAEEKIRELAEEGRKEYLEFLKRSAIEAVNAISSDEVVLRANENDLMLLDEMLSEIRDETGKDVELGEPVEVVGGVIAESKDGSEAYDNTVDARLRRRRSEIVRRVSETLFGG